MYFSVKFYYQPYGQWRLDSGLWVVLNMLTVTASMKCKYWPTYTPFITVCLQYMVLCRIYLSTCLWWLDRLALKIRLVDPYLYFDRVRILYSAFMSYFIDRILVLTLHVLPRSQSIFGDPSEFLFCFSIPPREQHNLSWQSPFPLPYRTFLLSWEKYIQRSL